MPSAAGTPSFCASAIWRHPPDMTWPSARVYSSASSADSCHASLIAYPAVLSLSKDLRVCAGRVAGLQERRSDLIRRDCGAGPRWGAESQRAIRAPAEHLEAPDLLDVRGQPA